MVGFRPINCRTFRVTGYSSIMEGFFSQPFEDDQDETMGDLRNNAGDETMTHQGNEFMTELGGKFQINSVLFLHLFI